MEVGLAPASVSIPSGNLNSQQFPDAHVIVSLCGTQTARQESAGMHLAINLKPLRKNRINSLIRCLHLHHKFPL